MLDNTPRLVTTPAPPSSPLQWESPQRLEPPRSSWSGGGTAWWLLLLLVFAAMLFASSAWTA